METAVPPLPDNGGNVAGLSLGFNGDGIDFWDTGAGFLPDAFPWSFEDAFATDEF